MANLMRILCASLAITTTLVSASPIYALEARQSTGTADLSACPGYKASNVRKSANGLTAQLSLAGAACNAYGTDLTALTLTVEYQSSKKIRWYSEAEIVLTSGLFP